MKNMFIPQLNVGFGDYYFIMSDHPHITFDSALEQLKYMHTIATESKFSIESMTIAEYNHGNEAEAEKYIGRNLSDLPYNERKDICDKYIRSIDYFINDDFSLFGTMQTLYDGSNCMRDEVDENYSCYNVGDKIITDANRHAVIVGSPGIPYNSLLWQNEYRIQYENGDIGYCYGNLITKEDS